MSSKPAAAATNGPSSSATGLPPSAQVSTATDDSSDTAISKKLDLLTSLIATLTEKTNLALSEVAKVNERLTSHPSPSASASHSGFHLDAPKSTKNWKDNAGSRSKSEKRSRTNKNATSGTTQVEKEAGSPPETSTPLNSGKRYTTEEEERRERGTGDDSGEMHSSETRGHESLYEDGSMPSHPTNTSPSRERGTAGRKQGSFSRNHPSLRSRASMSSIDLNDVQDMEALNTVVKLNVGGRQFCTTKYTLTSMPGTMFEALLSGRHAVVRDADGAIFLDRDPDTFEHVLTYLRDPRQLDLRYYTQHQQMRILCEMDFFMVPYIRLSRDLPYNLTGHTIIIERDNQWTMKWTNRGWWVGSDGVHSSEGASPSNASISSASSPSATASLVSAAVATSGSRSGSAAALPSPPPEPLPRLKFVDDLVYVSMRSRPLRAYDIWTGQCVKIIKDSYCDCFAVTSEQLVTYDADDQSLRLWNTRTSAGVSWIKADVPPTNISCLAFVNDTMLVLGGDGNKCVTLSLPSVPDLQATATTVLQGANLRQIEPLSTSVVAVGSTNGNIILWNVKLNVLVGTIPTAQQRISTIFARNNCLYCISPEVVKVWDCSTTSGKPQCIATIFDEVLHLDADGDLILGITADRARKSLIKVWSLSSSKLIHVMQVPAGETVHTIRIQGNRVATVLEDGTVLTWTINLLQ